MKKGTVITSVIVLLLVGVIIFIAVKNKSFLNATPKEPVKAKPAQASANELPKYVQTPAQQGRGL